MEEAVHEIRQPSDFCILIEYAKLLNGDRYQNRFAGTGTQTDWKQTEKQMGDGGGEEQTGKLFWGMGMF